MIASPPIALLCILILIVCPSCQTEEQERQWHTRTLYSLDSKIQTVAFGGLWEEERPCLALAAADGRCVVLWQEEGGWKSREMLRIPGGLGCVAIGDADPGTPGPDLILGTGGGQIIRIFLTHDDEVLVKVIYEAGAPIGDIAVSDLNPHKPGQEILVLTEEGKAIVLWPAEDDTDGYESLMVLQDTARLRNVQAGPYGPQGQPAAVMAGSSGNVSRIYAVADAYRKATLYESPEPLARLSLGNVDPVSQTAEVVLVDDVGLVTLLRLKSGKYVPQAIHKEDKALRGVAVGEFLLDVMGDEIAVYGYGREVALFYRQGLEFERIVVFEDTDRGHWLIADQILPDTEELELVAVGYSGKVTLIALEAQE
ncbi:MAG: hypothetical protein ACYTG7_17365 [Planctomycetota bacterium]